MKHIEPRALLGNRRRLTQIVLMLFFGLLAVNPVLTLFLELLVNASHFADYSAYYDAAYRLVRGYPIYDLTYGEHATGPSMAYLYPPLTVLLFVPFQYLPFYMSVFAWDLISFLVLGVSVLYLLRSLGITTTASQKILLLWCLLGFGPTVTWIRQGQVSGLLAAFLCVSGAALIAKDSDDRIAAVFATLAAFFKPFYAPAGAFLLRDKSRLFTAGVVGLALALASVIFFGLDTNLAYIDILLRGKGWGEYLAISRWHTGQYNPLYPFGEYANFARVVIVLFTIAVSLLSITVAGEEIDRLVWVLGVITLVIVGPSVNTVALNALVPAYVVTIATEVKQNRGLLFVPVGSAVLVHVHPYAIAGLAKYGPRVFTPLEILTPLLPYLQPALWGVVILYLFVLYDIFKTIPHTNSL